jgi:hypothetical protein
LIYRERKARDTAAWSDVNAISFVYVSLRGKVLKWHVYLKRSGVQHNNFAHFTTAFLESFAPNLTVQTAAVNLREVKQQPTENVDGFYEHLILKN